MSLPVEIAVEDMAGLEIAAHGGADRIELCTRLDAGGVTPTASLVSEATSRAAALVAAQGAKPHLEIHVLVRCRAGAADFLTTPDEFVHSTDEVELMAEQAREMIEAGADGVVIGALTPAGELDIAAVETIRDAALGAGAQALRGVSLTAHRAVDVLADAAAREEAVRTLLRLGFHRVLTSGGAARAVDAIENLSQMVEAAEGIVDICAGGGVRPAHVPDLFRLANVDGVHLSARRSTPPAPGDPQPETLTDAAVVQAAVDAAGAL